MARAIPASMEEVRRLLPKVGDRRLEVPTIDESQSTGIQLAGRKPQPCVVVAVNPGHLWYTVQFENGIRESYKVPKYIPPRGGPGR